MTRANQRGSAMLVTMIIIAALLAGAAVLASMQVNSNKATELTRDGLSSLYCAEHGLTAGKQAVLDAYGTWNTALAANCADSDCPSLVEPTFTGTGVFSHDIDGGTASVDFRVFIRDDDDDTGTQDYTTDTNDTIFIVARCIKYPDTPKQVEMLIKYTPGMPPYENQEGGANSRGNANDTFP